MVILSVRGIAASLRKFRSWHSWVGIILSLLVFISSVSGLFLSWKKESDLLQPPTQVSQTPSTLGWLPVEAIAETARQALINHTGYSLVSIDRMDIRPDKGIVKVNFEQAYWEVQIDGYSGEILSVAQRHSDWIEQVHDGSIISGAFKMLSMHALGLGLLVLIISGCWLWLGPKRIRKLKKQQA